MSDVRLIDANVLPNYKCQVTATIGDQKGPAEMRFVFWQDIEKAPTIDAVEVVRCRECEDWQRDWVCNRGGDGDHYCAVLDNVFPPDFYCTFGTKMDGGAEG